MTLYTLSLCLYFLQIGMFTTKEEKTCTITVLWLSLLKSTDILLSGDPLDHNISDQFIKCRHCVSHFQNSSLVYRFLPSPSQVAVMLALQQRVIFQITLLCLLCVKAKHLSCQQQTYKQLKLSPILSYMCVVACNVPRYPLYLPFSLNLYTLLMNLPCFTFLSLIFNVFCQYRFLFFNSSQRYQHKILDIQMEECF